MKNNYLIYDETGELLDVLSLTDSEKKDYEKSNPLYTVEKPELSIEFDEEFNENFDEDGDLYPQDMLTL